MTNRILKVSALATLALATAVATAVATAQRPPRPANAGRIRVKRLHGGAQARQAQGQPAIAAADFQNALAAPGGRRAQGAHFVLLRIHANGHR